MTHPFVHLNVHSEYSIVDSLIRIKALVEQTAKAGMPAIALTDQSALFAMVKFYRAAEQRGIKPIVGADVWLAHKSPCIAPRSRCILLCQDMQGYQNLAALISRSYLEGQHQGVPHIDWEWLNGHTQGLLALSGGAAGEVGQALLSGVDEHGMKRCIDRWLQCFPERFCIELQRTGRPQEEDYNASAVGLAAERGLPVVATNAVRFLATEDFEAHEARVCIHEGRTLADPRRPRNYSEQQYLRTPEEMAALFADLPAAIENTGYIAQRCNLELTLGKYFLPDFPVPEQAMSASEWFRQQALQGLEQRLQVLLDPQATDFVVRREAYDQRLQIELDVILKMGFEGYFLIVADFIQWAKSNGIPVGPGRGSGAGSLVAFALGITDLDPLQYDLLFERFLNPERVSMPDFDVDFCMDRRDEVIDYVARRYGRDHVSQIITHGSMAAKAVVRDVGRVLGHPYGFVDQIAKLIPFDLNMTLTRALAEEPALKQRYDAEEEVHTLFELALKLEGLVRNAGRHAGGVVIAPRPLSEFTPLYCEQGSQSPVSQFDMGDVEAIGLVKFDFLGLRTLTIIDWAVADINRMRVERGEAALDIARIPINDGPTFELIRRAETTAVFQLESRGFKELIKRLQPDVFEDLIALVALFRPGPLQSGMVDDFINRKHGRVRIEYPHPELEPILKPTYGVIVYQEQVMQIAQVLAGYSLGAADLLRRAMGKKKPEEMAKQRAIFVAGASAREVDSALAAGIFDLMEKFAGYGFNKSHSAAYALIAYQTAWLKAHYPAAFMAAVLSSDMDNTDKVVGLIEECNRMQLEVEPPAVNRCAYKFTVANHRAIRYGLGAIKGVGQNAVETVCREREAHGEYHDLFAFCRRLDTRKVNRRTLEALAKAGALDNLGPSRSSLLASLDQALQTADQHSRARAQGQDDLFGFAAQDDAKSGVGPRFVEVAEWSEEERLAGEKETLGLFLTGHPINRYEAELQGLVTCRLQALKPGLRRVAGLIVNVRSNNSRRGRMAVATLDDRSGRVDVVVYAETLLACQQVLMKDAVVVVEGNCQEDGFSGGYSIVAERVLDIDSARARHAKRVVLALDGTQPGADQAVAALPELLTPYLHGNCPVAIDYLNASGRARLQFGPAWQVTPNDALLERLRALMGGDNVRMEY